MEFKKGAQVTARLHESTKHKLMKTGYNAAQAIEWFVNEYYSNNPRRKLEIKQDLEEIELNKLKKVECEVQLEIEAKEKIINNLLLEKSKYPEVTEDVSYSYIDMPAPSVDVDVLTDGELEAVERVKSVWDMKKDMMFGSNDDVVEVFESFMVLNGDFINSVHRDCCKGKSFKDFKALLLEEVVQV